MTLNWTKMRELFLDELVTNKQATSGWTREEIQISKLLRRNIHTFCAGATRF